MVNDAAPDRPRADLAGLLARSLGVEVANARVAAAADALGLGERLTAVEALSVLEKLAVEPGLVGVSARFAKARIHLNWG